MTFSELAELAEGMTLAGYGEEQVKVSYYDYDKENTDELKIESVSLSGYNGYKPELIGSKSPTLSGVKND